MYPRLSFAATVSGVILQLAGLAVDAAPHTQDAGPVAHEGLLTLSSPGNLLFFVGLALTVLGVGATLLALLLRVASSVAPTTPGGAGRSRLMTAAIAPVLIAMTALVFVGGASTRHTHSVGHAPHDADSTRSHHTDEINTDEANTSQEQLRDIDRMLAEAKVATGKYQDVDIARADGYQQVMGALHGTGAHFVNQQYLDEDGFDVAHPEVLLYNHAGDGSLELVGVSYMLPRQSDNETPPTYFGPLAAWHDHDFHRPCLTTRTSGHPVIINSTEADCRAAGNVYIPPKFWMLHVWLFRPSPEGIFSHDNSTIEGPPDISVAGEVK